MIGVGGAGCDLTACNGMAEHTAAGHRWPPSRQHVQMANAGPMAIPSLDKALQRHRSQDVPTDLQWRVRACRSVHRCAQQTSQRSRGCCRTQICLSIAVGRSKPLTALPISTTVGSGLNSGQGRAGERRSTGLAGQQGGAPPWLCINEPASKQQLRANAAETSRSRTCISRRAACTLPSRLASNVAAPPGAPDSPRGRCCHDDEQ